MKNIVKSVFFAAIAIVLAFSTLSCVEKSGSDKLPKTTVIDGITYNISTDSCDLNSDCSADGAICYKNYCANPSVEAPKLCTSDSECTDSSKPVCSSSGECIAKTCEKACASGYSCYDGECIKIYQGCLANTDCKSDELCNNGVCEVKGCSSDADCGPLEKCSNGSCLVEQEALPIDEAKVSSPVMNNSGNQPQKMPVVTNGINQLSKLGTVDGKQIKDLIMKVSYLCELGKGERVISGLAKENKIPVGCKAAIDIKAANVAKISLEPQSNLTADDSFKLSDGSHRLLVKHTDESANETTKTLQLIFKAYGPNGGILDIIKKDIHITFNEQKLFLLVLKKNGDKYEALNAENNVIKLGDLNTNKPIDLKVLTQAKANISISSGKMKFKNNKMKTEANSAKLLETSATALALPYQTGNAGITATLGDLTKSIQLQYELIGNYFSDKKLKFVVLKMKPRADMKDVIAKLSTAEARKISLKFELKINDKKFVSEPIYNPKYFVNDKFYYVVMGPWKEGNGEMLSISNFDIDLSDINKDNLVYLSFAKGSNMQDYIEFSQAIFFTPDYYLLASYYDKDELPAVVGSLSPKSPINQNGEILPESYCHFYTYENNPIDIDYFFEDKNQGRGDLGGFKGCSTEYIKIFGSDNSLFDYQQD